MRNLGERVRVLIIDDDEALCRSLQIHLKRIGHEVELVHLGAAGLEHLGSESYDLAFVDLDLPDSSGLDILRELGKTDCPTTTVMITGIQDAKATIDAIRLGAFDYIRKPLDLEVVMFTLEKVRLHRAKVGASDMKTIGQGGVVSPHEIIGADPSIINMLKEIALVAESNVPVLIQGESGTGKELVARALHNTVRSTEPFVAVNCSAVVPTLLESELFGHVKGAFTSADSDKRGKLEMAGNGIVFFDEIGDMSYDLQAKLLRVLQEKEFERVGGLDSIPFKARVVAATHRDLQAMIAADEFREDLYYRLAVSTITVPPLRERRSDIPAIVDQILTNLAKELHKDIHGIDHSALHLCMEYDWPGNVRELINVLTRVVLLTRGPVVTEVQIVQAIGNLPAAKTPPIGKRTLRDAEKEHIYKALLSNDWNIKRTAELLDVSRVTLRKKIDDYKLVRPVTANRH